MFFSKRMKYAPSRRCLLRVNSQANVKSLHPQENIIREFNLNELFQKSKKLNKGRGSNGQEQNGYQAEEGGDELHAETDDPKQPIESKKDQ